MCMGNPEVKHEILKSVQNRDALVSMLKDAGKIAYWENFTESGRDQCDELIKVLDLNLDSFIEDHEDEGITDEGEDDFGDDTKADSRKASFQDRLSRGSAKNEGRVMNEAMNFRVPGSGSGVIQRKPQPLAVPTKINKK